MAAKASAADLEAVASSIRSEVQVMTGQINTELQKIRSAQQAGLQNIAVGGAKVERESTAFAQTVESNKQVMDAKLADMEAMAATAESFETRGASLKKPMQNGFAMLQSAQAEALIARDRQVQAIDAAFYRFDSHNTARMSEIILKHEQNMQLVMQKMLTMEAARAGQGAQVDPWPPGAAAAALAAAAPMAVNISGGDRDANGGDLYSELCHRRDLEVQALPEKVERDVFVLWREHVIEILGQSSDWRGISLALAMVLAQLEEVTVDVIHKVPGSQLGEFSCSTGTVQAKSSEL